MAKSSLPNNIPGLQKAVAAKDAQIIELRADKRAAETRTKEVVAAANKKNSAFRNLLASSTTYATAGAAGGFFIAWYFVWDYLASYFEEGSYVPGLLLAVAGGAFAMFAPRALKARDPDKSAQTALAQSTIRGFGLGVAGYGLWEFYAAWTAESAQV